MNEVSTSGVESTRPRVCFVRHSFYPSELNVKREAEALLREGFDVNVICLRGENEPSCENVGGVDVYRMPIGHRRGKISRYLFEYNAFFLLASIKLISLQMRRSLQFVQVNTMPDYLVFTALLPRLFGAKVILHMHEPMPELFRTLFPKRYHAPFVTLIKLFERLSLGFADRVLTVTREMRDNFGRRGADINKVTVVVNVPDDELFRMDSYRHVLEELASVKKEEHRRGVFRIVTHGTIEERYGLDLILKAMVRLNEKLPGLEFHVLGQGDYVDDFLVLAQQLKLQDKVHYKGFLPFDEMIREILAADVGVVPMKKNPYSILVHTNKMYEYIALEKPVIASRLGAVASYFSDDSLVYFEPDSDEDLSEKIYWVYAHPEELAGRVRRASEIYETYRWDREKKKYLGVYQGFLGKMARQTIET